jgi:hypothetical protein
VGNKRVGVAGKKRKRNGKKERRKGRKKAGKRKEINHAGCGII